MDMESVLMIARWEGGEGEGRELGGANGLLQNSHGDVWCSMGDGVANELISMT